MTFGLAEKFIFLFDEPFWAQELAANPMFSGYGFAYNEDDIEDLTEIMVSLLGREVTPDSLSIVLFLQMEKGFVTNFMISFRLLGGKI